MSAPNLEKNRLKIAARQWREYDRNHAAPQLMLIEPRGIALRRNRFKVQSGHPVRTLTVIAGLDPAIQIRRRSLDRNLDHRVKPGDDDGGYARSPAGPAAPGSRSRHRDNRARRRPARHAPGARWRGRRAATGR